MDLQNNYKEILLLCLVIGLFIICYYWKLDNIENFVVNNAYYKVKPVDTPLGKQFNIDDQCNNGGRKYLGWKCWWRDNQSEFLVPKDDSFKGTHFQNYLNNVPLKYDGVFKL